MLTVAVALLSAVALEPVGEAQTSGWVAGGWASASWSQGWPAVDIRARAGAVLSGGHEVGATAGITSERLASRLLYLAHYTHTWAGEGRSWPVVSIWAGGATDLLAIWAQTRAIIGTSIGVRLPLGWGGVAVRVDLGHEVLTGDLWADRTFLALGLEVLAVPAWRRP